MRGILFNPEMRKATEEGRKTVARQLRGLEKINQEPDAWYLVASFDDNTLFRFASDKLGKDLLVKPCYLPGETYYIKEAWHNLGGLPDERSTPVVFYKSEIEEDMANCTNTDDFKILKSIKWRSPLFMPAWAARRFIKMLNVRPERLHEITDEEAILEGITVTGRPQLNELSRGKFRFHFLMLWDSINPKYPTAINPWVFRDKFELVPRPEGL